MQIAVRGLVLALCLMMSAIGAKAAQYAALVMDARNGKVVHARNADTPVHPASLTKMMTLYIVFDEVQRGRLSLDQKVKISKHAASEPPSKLGLRAGQTIELRYLIRASAVKSANDAATALAEAVAGSETAFAKRMNAYAKAMGMRRTTFRNAHGLTETGHMSTARDMAVLGRRLVYDFPQYYNLFSRNSTSAGIKTVRNTNRRLLDAYRGADGIKTGYTRAAGFSLVSSAQRGNKRVIVSMLGGRTSASRNAEVARLMDLGFQKMPAQARLVKPAPLRTRVVEAAPPRPVANTDPAPLGSTAGVAERQASRLALAGSMRPMPRTMQEGGTVTRASESLAKAIAEVNEDLSAAKAARRVGVLDAIIGRPYPRPDPGQTTSASLADKGPVASTFAVAPNAPKPRSEARAVALTASGAGSTGGDGWGVQIGSYRAKGDAEQQLLTTALKDVPQLDGGLRRVEAASVQGKTVYRAQFVGLSQSAAFSACETLVSMRTDCIPIAPGI